MVSVGQNGSPLSGVVLMWEVLDEPETFWKGTQVKLSVRKAIPSTLMIGCSNLAVGQCGLF